MEMPRNTSQRMVTSQGSAAETGLSHCFGETWKWLTGAAEGCVSRGVSAFSKMVRFSRICRQSSAGHASILENEPQTGAEPSKWFCVTRDSCFVIPYIFDMKSQNSIHFTVSIDRKSSRCRTMNNAFPSNGCPRS